MKNFKQRLLVCAATFGWAMSSAVLAIYQPFDAFFGNERGAGGFTNCTEDPAILYMTANAGNQDNV